MRRAPRGFTLVELLVAVTIWAIAVSALGVLFSAGISIWRRLPAVAQAQAVAMAVAEMAQMKETEIAFKPLDELSDPDETVLRCVQLVRTAEGVEQLGQVTYWVEGDKLWRRRQTVSQATDEEEGVVDEMAGGVLSLETQELFYHKLTEQFQTDPPLGRTFASIKPRPDAARFRLRVRSHSGREWTVERMVRLSQRPPDEEPEAP